MKFRKPVAQTIARIGVSPRRFEQSNRLKRFIKFTSGNTPSLKGTTAADFFASIPTG